MKAYYIYIPENQPKEPIAIKMKPSKECDEYHKNSVIQFNIDGKTILKKINEEPC